MKLRRTRDAGRRLIDRFKFLLERLVLRGTSYRLLLVAALIGFVCGAGGMLALQATSSFSGPGEAIWWAFLRMANPAYLSGDEGPMLRTLGTVVTVAGQVLFVGALVAIMAKWVNDGLGVLESGLTPITGNGHVLILGWTNRTPEVIRELLRSGQIRKRLQGRDPSKVQIVILAREVKAALARDLKATLGELWKERQITFRSGSPLRIDQLQRVDYVHSSVIILPGGDFSKAKDRDLHTIKALLTITNRSLVRSDAEFPFAVAEIFDPQQIPVAGSAYGGSLEVLASDVMVSRLIAQNVRHPGLSSVYRNLLTQGRGCGIHIRDLPRFARSPLRHLAPVFPRAVVLGVVRPEAGNYRPMLNPPDGFVREDGDRLVLLACNVADTEPLAGSEPRPPPRKDPILARQTEARDLRVLVLGWSHKVAMLIREFDEYRDSSFSIDLLSPVSVAQRNEDLSISAVQPNRVQVHHLEGDYTIPSVLAQLNLRSYDRIVLLGSDEVGSGERSDAETLLAYLLIRKALPSDATVPTIVVELLDPDNAVLFRRRPGEVLVSPLLLSHMLAQIALQRELRSVYDHLFGSGGAEIFFRSALEYGAVGREIGFPELQNTAAQRGETALGIRSAPHQSGHLGRVWLNPDPNKQWAMREEDEVVALASV